LKWSGVFSAAPDPIDDERPIDVKWLAIALVGLALCGIALLLWRRSDTRAEKKVWDALLRQAGPVGPAFEESMIAGLPEIVQRYFRYTIAPGTPLVSVVEIQMSGQLGLGTQKDPGYQAMSAHQILSPPAGLLWRVQAGALSGSDAVTPDTSWTRFWLFRSIPVVRVSGNPDHHRSAFGRVVSEGAFWVPASLLPGSNVSWRSLDENTARATVSCRRYTQSIDLTIEADGRPSRVVIRRWSNENVDKVYREQPFGGYLSDFQDNGGYRLPMHVEGGNLIGTEDYFPFYIAEVRSVRFPQLEQ
jgi:hypothetical protein